MSTMPFWKIFFFGAFAMAAVFVGWLFWAKGELRKDTKLSVLMWLLILALGLIGVVAGPYIFQLATAQ